MKQRVGFGYFRVVGTPKNEASFAREIRGSLPLWKTLFGPDNGGYGIARQPVLQILVGQDSQE